MSPSYQRIIGLGSAVVPLLLRELERQPDHWFWALKAITGADPVPAASRGKLHEMNRLLRVARLVDLQKMAVA